jgi:uncharacterized damage-inducible protein DinB
MYIDLLPDDGRVLERLSAGHRLAVALTEPLSESLLTYRYAPDRWSIKEILVHIVDDERIYAYRALRFARGDATPLPGFEQDAYASRSGADDRTVAAILEEYAAVRTATIALFTGLPDEAFSRGGFADGNFATVRALLYHIAGHEAHHLQVIRSRYLHPVVPSAGETRSRDPAGDLRAPDEF